MSVCKNYSDAFLLMVLQMREDGWSYADIAKHYKTSAGVISRIVRELEADLKASEAQ